MVFKPQGSTLTPLRCSCTVVVGAHGLSLSQSREMPQKPSSAAELVGQSVHGEVFILTGAAQCVEGTGQAAAGSITSPTLSELTTQTALGKCESLPDTSAWCVPPMAWRDV